MAPLIPVPVQPVVLLPPALEVAVPQTPECGGPTTDTHTCTISFCTTGRRTCTGVGRTTSAKPRGASGGCGTTSSPSSTYSTTSSRLGHATAGCCGTISRWGPPGTPSRLWGSSHQSEGCRSPTVLPEVGHNSPQA